MTDRMLDLEDVFPGTADAPLPDRAVSYVWPDGSPVTEWHADSFLVPHGQGVVRVRAAHGRQP